MNEVTPERAVAPPQISACRKSWVWIYMGRQNFLDGLCRILVDARPYLEAPVANARNYPLVRCPNRVTQDRSNRPANRPVLHLELVPVTNTTGDRTIDAGLRLGGEAHGCEMFQETVKLLLKPDNYPILSALQTKTQICGKAHKRIT